jgi:hypothetical protein
MTVARKQFVCHNSTPYYHCINRCVRRTFLRGFDNYLNKSYEHHREWVESLILSLSLDTPESLLSLNYGIR